MLDLLTVSQIYITVLIVYLLSLNFRENKPGVYKIWAIITLLPLFMLIEVGSIIEYLSIKTGKIKISSDWTKPLFIINITRCKK